MIVIQIQQNKMKSKIFYYLIFIIIIIWGSSCKKRVYPLEKFKMNQKLQSFYYAIARNKELYFTNPNKEKKYFKILVDSLLINEDTTGFMSGRGSRALMMSIKEIGNDTVHIERKNEIMLVKVANRKATGIYIDFCNLYYDDTILPNIIHDTLTIQSKKFSEYYEFKSFLKPKSTDFIEILYATPNQGIIGFKSIKGEMWLKK